MDALLWSQVDFQSGQIRIEATGHFQPKSEDSIGAVDLDDELLALLRGWKARATGPFVIESTRRPRYDHSRANYRAALHFESLYTWLRSEGITARKPLHELRKEPGALLAGQDGIFAAQRVLRHAQISITAACYADKKRRITAGLGSLPAETAAAIPFASSAAADVYGSGPAAGGSGRGCRGHSHRYAPRRVAMIACADSSFAVGLFAHEDHQWRRAW